MSEKRLDSIDEQGRRLEVAFEQAEAVVPQHTRRRRRKRFALAASGGLAVAIVAAFAIAGTGDSGGGGILTVEEAVAAVSKAAFAHPGTEPDKYTYEKSRNTSLGGGKGNGFAYSRITPITTESWSRKGEKKGWMRVTYGTGTFPTEEDRTAFDESNRAAEEYAKKHHQKTYVPIDREETFTCHTVLVNSEPLGTPGSVLRLKNESAIPTNAKSVYRRLLRLIREQPGTSSVGTQTLVWGAIGWAMEGGAPKLTPQQRAAFVGALLYVPGVRTLGRTTDPNGNPTIGFARDAGGRRDVLYFDAETSRTTYVAQTLTRPKKISFTVVPAGTTIWSHELLDYRHLDELPPLKQSKVTKNSMAWMQCPELRHTKR